MSLNVLNTSQNFIITLGLLTGMLYCGKLVVDGKLTVMYSCLAYYLPLLNYLLWKLAIQINMANS